MKDSVYEPPFYGRMHVQIRNRPLRRYRRGCRAANRLWEEAFPEARQEAVCIPLGKGRKYLIFRHLRHALKLRQHKTEVGLKPEKRLRRGVVSDGYIGNGHAEGIFADGGGAGYA